MTDATWNDRPVRFVEFSLLAGDQVVEAYAHSSRHGGRMLILHSARYADTDEPVFTSIEEIEALPFRHFQRITYLAARAAFVNGFAGDPDDDPQLAAAATNAPGPSS